MAFFGPRLGIGLVRERLREHEVFAELEDNAPPDERRALPRMRSSMGQRLFPPDIDCVRVRLHRRSTRPKGSIHIPTSESRSRDRSRLHRHAIIFWFPQLLPKERHRSQRNPDENDMKPCSVIWTWHPYLLCFSIVPDSHVFLTKLGISLIFATDTIVHQPRREVL